MTAEDGLRKWPPQCLLKQQNMRVLGLKPKTGNKPDLRFVLTQPKMMQNSLNPNRSKAISHSEKTNGGDLLGEIR